jgi:uncharacterized protein (DUF58 family)
VEWKRETSDSNLISACIFLCLFLSLLGLILQNLMILSIFLLSFALFYGSQSYIHHAGKRLVFKNERNKEKFNKGDRGEWSFKFENTGLPILNGSLILRFDDVVIPIGIDYDEFPGGIIEMKIPFSLSQNERIEVRFPIEARRRGLARIAKLTVDIPNLFGSGGIQMQYDKPVKSDILVFPQSKSVDGFTSAHTKIQGDFTVLNSLFNDPFQPVGTREYTPGDSFASINWKATAKMQSLQTKIHSPATSRNWLITLNISAHYSITSNLEEMIERTAYIIEMAAKQGIPFALAVNVRSFSGTPFYYLTAGEGMKQRQRALELLSVLSADDVTFPFSQLYQFLLMHHQVPPVLISIGEQDKESEKLLSIMNQRDVSVFQLENHKEQGVLQEWKQQSRKYA